MSHVKIVILILKNCLVIHILCFELNTFKKYDVPRGGGGIFEAFFVWKERNKKERKPNERWEDEYRKLYIAAL